MSGIHCADLCGGMWLRDIELLYVAGIEVPAVTSRGSTLTLPVRRYVVPMEVVSFLQAAQRHIGVFSW